MSRFYIDATGARIRKPARFKDMPEAWIEEKDEDGDTCDQTYIDERNLYVRCGRFALNHKKGKALCKKHLAATKN